MKSKAIILILLITLIIPPIKTWSQYKEIRGKIVDKETLEAIPYCSISLKNSLIGCCTNSSGEFIFHYPDSLLNRDLIITCIGYKTVSLRLDSLNCKVTANITLIPELYQLSEINVIPNQMSAKDIVKQVIRRMHKNFPRKPYYLEGFMRDKVYNLYDNKTTRLTEAAIGIEKREFGNENNAEKVKVLEIRNSYNYSKLGSSIKEKLIQMFYGYSNENPVYATLQNADYASNKALSQLIKDDLFHIFFSGQTMLNGKAVFIVDLKEEYFMFMFQKWPTNGRLYHLIRLYIEDGSYAILKSEYYTIMNIPKELFNNDEIKFHIKQDTIATFAVKQYEKIEGQYYLKYAGNYGRIHDQPDLGEMGKTLYNNETEVLINKTIVNRKEFDRISRKNSLQKDIPLWDMKYIYDPSFWQNYNILEDKPLDPSVKKDLEREVPLYEQFINAGVKNSKK